MDEAAFEEGVEAARGIIERVQASGTTPAEHLLYLYEMRPAELRDDLLRGLAYCSTEVTAAWDALDLIAARLKREGRPLPSELAPWVEDRPVRPNKSGPDPDGDLPRNMSITVAIRHLEFRGWTVTRRVKRNGKALPRCCAEGGTACDAVGMAAGIGGYKNVERIWTQAAKPESPIYRRSPRPSWWKPLHPNSF